VVVQQCAVGLVRIRRQGARLAFAAPPTRRSGPLEPERLATIRRALGLAEGDVLHHQWVDNGPGWGAVMLRSAAAVRAVQVDGAVLGDIKLGLVGAHPAGGEVAFEVRALFNGIEDPVTGSLNASLAQWLIGAGLAPASYVASQGHALGRDGRVFVQTEGRDIWVGGDVVACIDGEVTL
ncbi:MAG: hypothetical protein RJA10_2932, partial [Pseudomonadota bacterium]